MKSGLFTVACGLLAATLGMTAASAAFASSKDKAFFNSVAGTWKGPGEIVAGKYKGTKFSCNLVGSPTEDSRTGIKLDGTCRVGVFSQPMSAVIAKSGNSYKGQFLDGADGKGLDVVSGSVKGDKVTIGINRAKLSGAMVARLDNDNAMNVTISVKVEDQMIPVIGLNLSRIEEVEVGSIK